MKKPELFVNKIDKELRNNDNVFYSKNEIKEKKITKKNTDKSVIQKINTIFSSPNYVYKANVKIKFKDKEEVKKIVGKNRTHLITMDNELIPINTIIDIEIV